jgi:hypothetical protein
MRDLLDQLKSLIARRREAAGHPSGADNSHVDAIVGLLKRSQPRRTTRSAHDGNGHRPSCPHDRGRG